MNRNEKLVLAAKAFEDQIKTAQEALVVNFRDPIRAWVKHFKDREVVVADSVKAFIRRTSAVDAFDSVNAGAVETGFLAASKASKFTKADYERLIQAGMLVPVASPELADQLVAARIGSKLGYTLHIPAVEAGWTDELRLNVLPKGRFEGLKDQLKRTVNLEKVIIDTANSIESVDLDVKQKEGTVTIK